ncbi:MAG: hypothetical protein QOG62_2561 [Thermoleophilaceae bacterium]|jgi:PAS domain S-box-containing protein|nr:hypothetical protein [Thermoleophilaceae bacterium]
MSRPTETSGSSRRRFPVRTGRAHALRGRWLGLFLGIGALIVLGVLDMANGPAVSLMGTFAVAPVICALLAGPRTTAAVAVLALAVAGASGYRHGTPVTDPTFAIRLGVLALVGTISTLASLARSRLEGYADQMQLLAGVGEVVDGSLPPDETISRVLDVVVPTLADVCILDTVGSDGKIARNAVRANGPRLKSLEQRLFERAPTGPRAPGATRIVLTGKPVLVEDFGEEYLTAAAHDADDLALMRSVGCTSAIFVPVRARGRTLGAVTLLATGQRPRYTHDDLAFAELLASRFALALDNAGLSSELVSTQNRMAAIMGTLAEAVTVQDLDGNLVYTNQAGAELLGFDTVEQVLSAAPGELLAHFQMFHPDGRAIAPDELPGRRVLAGKPAPTLLVRSVRIASGEEGWHLVKSSAVRDGAGQAVLAVNVMEDVTDAKRTEFHQRFLARSSELLADTLESREALEQVAQLLVPELGEWCTVLVPGARGQLEPASVAGGGAAGRPRDGSEITAPMLIGETLVGQIVVARSGRGPEFDEIDQALLEEFGRRAASAVENARLNTERTSVSAALQQGLLPPELPAMDGWLAASLYRAAGEQTQVGGDFYDVFRVPAGWMAVVGDVAGRGAPAASLTALARYTIRTAGQLGSTPEEAFELVNRALRERGDLSLCAVVAVQLVDQADGAVATVACAGNPPPLLLRGGEADPVGRLGPFLGAFDDGEWQTEQIEIQRGDQLVLHTDGVLDAVGAAGRFGEQRLRTTLKGARSAADTITRVEHALDRFEVGSQRDDTAVLAVMRAG